MLGFPLFQHLQRKLPKGKDRGKALEKLWKSGSNKVLQAADRQHDMEIENLYAMSVPISSFSLRSKLNCFAATCPYR